MSLDLANLDIVKMALDVLDRSVPVAIFSYFFISMGYDDIYWMNSDTVTISAIKLAIYGVIADMMGMTLVGWIEQLTGFKLKPSTLISSVTGALGGSTATPPPGAGRRLAPQNLVLGGLNTVSS